MKRIASAVSLGAALLFASVEAFAFCRTTTCDQQNPPASCGAAPAAGVCNTAGTPIAWPSTCVSTSVSALGSVKSGITADQMRNIVQNAFQQWTTVDCGSGTTPNFTVDMFPDVNCTNVGYTSTGPNSNLWIFHDSDWPYGTEAELAIALTTTQFNPATGEIYDSDVELNSSATPPAPYDLLDYFTTTTDPNLAYFDLPSVVQHESGHFLGSHTHP